MTHAVMKTIAFAAFLLVCAYALSFTEKSEENDDEIDVAA